MENEAKETGDTGTAPDTNTGCAGESEVWNCEEWWSFLSDYGIGGSWWDGGEGEDDIPSTDQDRSVG